MNSDLLLMQPSAINARETMAGQLGVGTDLPLIEVRLESLTIAKTDHVAVTDQSVSGYVLSTLGAPFRACAVVSTSMTQSLVLDNVTLTFRPSSSTCILSAPGGGATTLLKVISGRTAPTSGAITYNGTSVGSLTALHGAYVRKLAAFGAATDEHEALLTVREAVSFAYATSTATSAAPTSAPVVPQNSPTGMYSLPTPEGVIAALGLSGAADTIAGGLIFRGLSGGEKRRLSVAETLVSGARIVALDCPTDGLDSATAFDLVAYAARGARDGGGIFVAALQQPTPETLGLFDDVILLAGGRVLFHGPVATLDGYLASLGFARPGYAELAEWALEVVANPTGAATASIEDRFGDSSGAIATSGGSDVNTLIPTLLSPSQLADAWQDSPQVRASAASGVGARIDGIQLTTPAARAQYGAPIAVPFAKQFALMFLREAKLVRRNWLYAAARLMLTAGMGFVLGSVFPYLNSSQAKGLDEPTDFTVFFSLTLYALTYITFISNTAIPFTAASRGVVYKHTGAALFGEGAYVLASVAAAAPLSIVTDFLFATPLYFISQYTQDGGRWAFFCLVVTLQDLVSSALYRAMTFAAPTEEAALIGSGVAVAVALSLGNYFVIIDQIGWWLKWLVYASPFFWSETAAVNNEFMAPRYDVPVPGGAAGDTLGMAYLRAFSFPSGMAAKWGGIGVLLAWWLVGGLTLQVLALKFVRHDAGPVGTRRVPALTVASEAGAAGSDAAPDAAAEAQLVELSKSKRAVHHDGAVANEKGAAAVTTGAVADAQVIALAKSLRFRASHHGVGVGSNASTLPHTPITYAFANVSYRVQVKGPDGRPTDKHLLRGVTGYAAPGTLTALMGASGAGKTTLLDVLAFRKNTGIAEGERLLNRQKATHALFSRHSGYCEQEDIHMTPATVRESLEFSAALRLAADIDGPSRARFIDDILRVLELIPLSNRRVSSLGKGELKRLTVGVELAANSSLLFCDEVRTATGWPTVRTSVDCTVSKPPSRRFLDATRVPPYLTSFLQPTTGLDSRSAAVVMRVLRNVASTGRTIICTIHQPSAEVFFAFDNLLVLQPGGLTAYFGSLGYHGEEMVRYFSSFAGVEPLPAHVNPATWMLETLGRYGSRAALPSAVAGSSSAPATTTATPGERSATGIVDAVRRSSATTDAANGSVAIEVVAHPTGTERDTRSRGEVFNFATAYATSAMATDAGAIVARASVAAATVTSAGSSGAGANAMESAGGAWLEAAQRPVGYWAQFSIVAARARRVLWREAAYGGNRIFGVIGLALFYGLLFLTLDGSFSGVQSRMGAILAAPGFLGLVTFTSAIPLYYRMRRVFYREVSARVYSPTVYAWAIIVAELPWMIGVSTVFTCIFYFMAHFQLDPARFFFFLLATVVCALSFFYAGIAASNLVPSAVLAQIGGGVFLAMAWMFAYVFLSYGRIPVWWRWFSLMDFASHLVRAVVLDQFYCDTNVPGCPSITVTTSAGPQLVYTYDFMTAQIGVEYFQRWGEMGWAIFIMCLIILSAVYVHRALNWQRR